MTILHTQDGVPVRADNRLPVELYGPDGAPLFATKRAAADNLALPTAPDVLATLLARDGGGLLDLLRTSDTAGGGQTDGALAVVPHLWHGTSSSFNPAISAYTDATGSTRVPLVNAGTFNNSTFDRQRGNTEGTVLASAARAVTTSSADLTNHNARGVLLYLNVTANPGGGETLQLAVQAKDPISAGYAVLAQAAASALGGGTGLIGLLVYPGAASAGVDLTHAQAPLPRTWRARVVHSAAGSWTYSVGFALVV